MRNFLKKLEGWNKAFWYHTIFRLLFKNETLAVPAPLGNVRKVLIFKHDFIGDMVLATSCFNVLKQIKPDIRIDVVASDKSFPLLVCDSRLTQCYQYQNSLTAIIDLIKDARKVGYDMILCLTFSSRTKDGLLANLIAPNAVKVTIADEGREDLYKRLFNLQVSVEENQFTQQYANVLIKGFGLPLTEDDIRPSVEPCQESFKKVDAFLTQHQISDFLLLNISGRLSVKQWGRENARLFIKQFFSQHNDIDVVLVEVPDVMSEIVFLKQEFSQDKLFSFKGTILDVAALASKARLVVTPDSALSHLSATYARPVVTLCSPVTYSKHWHPYKTEAVLLHAPKDAGIEMISHEAVATAVQTLLEKTKYSLSSE
ncbi:MAG: glycosyltransferase family 9 protein [Chloroherpetonaceae bacterium]